MRAAAQNGMKHACQWLYKHGASADICRAAGDERHNYPLHNALNPWDLPNRDVSTASWLVLHGAIPTEIDGRPNNSIMEEIFSIGTNFPSSLVQERVAERKRLLQWAENVCSTHDGFFVFLCGNTQFSRSANILNEINHSSLLLSGHEGIRRRIGGFVGVMTGRNLRTVRGIVGPLKNALEQVKKS